MFKQLAFSLLLRINDVGATPQCWVPETLWGGMRCVHPECELHAAAPGEALASRLQLHLTLSIAGRPKCEVIAT